MRPPEELLQAANELRQRQSRIHAAILTGRLDDADPDVVTARAFLDGLEWGLRAVVGDRRITVPDNIEESLTPVPLGETVKGKTLTGILNNLNNYRIGPPSIGSCTFCGAGNVDVTSIDSDEPVPQFACVDMGACRTRIET